MCCLRFLVCVVLVACSQAAAERIYELGLLSEPSAAEPETIARAYLERVDAKRAEVAATSIELSTASVRSDRAGLTHLLFEQRRNGVRLFDGDVQVAVDSRGRVRSRSGGLATQHFVESIDVDALRAVEAALGVLEPRFDA